MEEPRDDEDWLYRRGRYAGEPTSDASTSGSGDMRRRVPDQAPPPFDEPRPTRPADPPPTYGEPTPVGHYGSSAPRPAPVAPPPSGRGPRPGTTRAPKPRRRIRGRVIMTVVALLLAYLLGIPLVAFALTPRTDATPTGTRPADTPGHVYVLAGSDSRAGLSTEEQNRLGTGSDAGQRTDSIMLLYVPPVGRAALVSIPRDSYVSVPGHGRNKINAAYAFGGPALLVDTVENNTGLHVDGYMEIGFGGFSTIVDALGGIEMCPPNAIKDRDSNLDIPAGCQQMDGATALGYVRMRKADPEGDLGRAKRQREMVTALVKKALSPATVLLPWRWWGLNWASAQSLTFGNQNGIGETLGLVNGGGRMALGQGDMLVVPVGNADAHTNAGSAVLWDPTRAKALFDAMARGEGDLRPYAG